MKTENKKSSNGLKHSSLSKLFVLQITSTIVHIHVHWQYVLSPRTTSPDPESETADDDRVFQALSLSIRHLARATLLCYNVHIAPVCIFPCKNRR